MVHRPPAIPRPGVAGVKPTRALPWTMSLALVLATLAAAAAQPAPPRTFDSLNALRQAAIAAPPGTTLLLAPGTYRGHLYLANLKGLPGQPITLAGADPQRPPVIVGDEFCIQLADPAHVVLRDMVLTGATGNGLNIDDAGSYDSPAFDITLQRLRVHDIGPDGNRDGIKLSGVRRFRITECSVANWGSGGSAIDMVGCHEGLIEASTFTADPKRPPATGVQIKGGSTGIVIRRCRFLHAGDRAVQIGGSTGMGYFRPQPPPGYEARDITVEGCSFLGSQAPIACTGIDGSTVRFNTFHRPRGWLLRILQETRQPGFVPSRNGRFTDNLIVFRSDEMTSAVNIGPATSPESFVFERNAWYCLDRPARSAPALPTPERQGVHGIDPRLPRAEEGDLTPAADSPLRHVGAHALPAPPSTGDALP